ncbi:hypothetical protein UlMin_006667 [Ulmus minor]
MGVCSVLCFSKFLLRTLTKKNEVDSMIRDTIDKVLILHFGCASEPISLLLDNVSKFASIALVDIDSDDVGVYVKYFDVTFIPSTIFFFNANHMKMDSGIANHTKWVGAFQQKQDFIDVVELLPGAHPNRFVVQNSFPFSLMTSLYFS